MTPLRVAVVGGGWAGLAAAVQATHLGHRVSLFEMAPRLGGRARSVPVGEHLLDNGQHILIGAYRDTLALMRRVGVDPDRVLRRLPLTLAYPDAPGLRLPPGAPLPAFVRGVLGHRGWPVADRLRLLAVAGGWLARGFRCDPAWTVARLAAGLPASVVADLIEPLCVAALNTPASTASARVFLRVLRDALFRGAGSSDLLLPRAPLDALLPDAAATWLQAHGAQLHLGRRVGRIGPAAAPSRPGGPGWQLDDEAPFDDVVLACTAVEAARLARPVAPEWADTAAAFEHEPIVTVYLSSPGSRLAQPMMALRERAAAAPAQFVFDLGAIGGAAGVFAAVVSGARPWVERGLDATTEAVLTQLHTAFAAGTWRSPLTVLRTLAERRATFACVPGLSRPPARVAPGWHAAGDHVDGPYPSTLEGAVRSGLAAAGALGA